MSIGLPTLPPSTAFSMIFLESKSSARRDRTRTHRIVAVAVGQPIEKLFRREAAGKLAARYASSELSSLAAKGVGAVHIATSDFGGRLGGATIARRSIADRRTAGEQVSPAPLTRCGISAKKVNDFNAKKWRWCPGKDSNLHGLHRWYLKPVRLPIPPPGHERRIMSHGEECQRPQRHSRGSANKGVAHRQDGAVTHSGRGRSPFPQSTHGASQQVYDQAKLIAESRGIVARFGGNCSGGCSEGRPAGV